MFLRITIVWTTMSSFKPSRCVRKLDTPWFSNKLCAVASSLVSRKIQKASMTHDANDG